MPMRVGPGRLPVMLVLPHAFLAAMVTYVLLVVAACSPNPADPEPPSGPSLRVRLADSTGRTPPLFSVIATPAGGKTLSAFCSGQAPPHAAITRLPDGFRIDGAALQGDTVTLVVKAPGYHATTRRLALSSNRDKAVDLRVTALEPFVANPDFATGFSAQGGKEQFLSMSVKSKGETGVTQTIKFYVEDWDGAPKVYFQNTIRHALHYAFARDVLGKAVTLEEFENQTYYDSSRHALAGELVWHTGYAVRVDSSAPGLAGAGVVELASPLTLEFAPGVQLTASQIISVQGLLEERLLFLASACDAQERLYYLPPTAAHAGDWSRHRTEAQTFDVPHLTREALYRGIALQLLNSGESYGTLQYVTPESLKTLPVSFRDILLLSRLPNDLPLVGGTLTEELQTPLSHVNVAARGRKTPNMALLGAASKAEIRSLIGSLVHFKVSADTFVLEKASLAEAEAFWKGRVVDPPVLPEADTANDTLKTFSQLSFVDRVRVGVKAANLAELSRVLGPKAPLGFAVPFARYARFMKSAAMQADLNQSAQQDCEQEGRTSSLCADVAAQRSPFSRRLAPLQEFVDSLLQDRRFQNDSRFREAALDGLRYHIRHIPLDKGFSAVLDRFADSLLHGSRIRLRSSTNAEDLEDFNGAGLYSSTGADAGGPESASVEILKVWASVWNWQAFEERSLRGIDHREVYMAVAVHPAFSDELANGVLITRDIAHPYLDGFYVNVQPGETSVTNPTDGSLPEIFSLIGPAILRQRYSSLSPDAAVLADSEAVELGRLASLVHRHFARLYRKDPRDPSFALDIEFKLDDPNRTLFFKQVRPFSP